MKKIRNVHDLLVWCMFIPKRNPQGNRFIFRMGMTCLLLICLGSARAQSQQVTLSPENAGLEKVLRDIKKQTGFTFYYTDEVISKARPVTINAKSRSLEDVLKEIFASQPIDYNIREKVIILKLKVGQASDRSQERQVSQRIIKGIVSDDKGAPLSGASVKVNGAPISVTNNEGKFTILITSQDRYFTISSIGFQQREVVITQQETYEVKMAIDTKELSSVIITGVTEKKRETFTGAASVFSGEQLRNIGNKNILENLKSLDPSFVIYDNNLKGSDPNALPSIEIRGKTSISGTTTNDLNDQFNQNPNQPLFILDGFESTLEIIYNLDINRVSSISILKDAAATALYGSKAANGVVVVETLRPKAGELRISLTTGLNLELPDLNSYDLMNSAEKLEFERLSGLYTAYPGGTLSQYSLNQQYNARLAEIQRGVDTYWLNEPLQTAYTSTNSLRLSGGGNNLQFSAGATYNKVNGVMKGSANDRWGGNFDLSYRKGKINVLNLMNISGAKAENSPYGSFSNFANANPYFRKDALDGNVSKYLEVPGVTTSELGYRVGNPLYEGELNSYNKSNGFNFRNSLQVIYDVLPGLRLNGSGQVTRGTSTRTIFTSPASILYDNTAASQKGDYRSIQVESSAYQVYTSLTYGKVFNNAHTINSTVRADIEERFSKSSSYAAVGFPLGANGNPAFSYGYIPFGKPSASTVKFRSNSLLGTVNYAYKLRYMLDATYRLDGSTAFGSREKYQSFWSVGLGWNIHNETFAKVTWINNLKLRGNVGVTGNQNLGTYTSTSVYNYLPVNNLFGQVLDLTSLGNPDLAWQNTRQISLGTDITLFGNRLNMTIDRYFKHTDPLVVGIGSTFPSSLGIPGEYPVNVGQLKASGWEANIRVSPIYNQQKRIIWSVGVFGAKINSKYRGIERALSKLDEAQLSSGGLIRFRDGYSPDDLWAVVSKGIDPATGMEIFLKKDGTETFTYTADDVVKIGNARPDIEGVVNTNLTYKNLNIGISMRYRIGGYRFNDALFNKVENISNVSLRNNQDRRALYGRWQKPGDVSQFKAIDNRSAQIGNDDDTPLSSRFIQKDSSFSGESLSVGYTFRANSWIRKLHMQTMNLSFTTNNLFRLETIRSERGIEYPFSRTYTILLTTSF